MNDNSDNCEKSNKISLKVINFYDELKDKNNLHKDKVHLSDQGIERLKTILINYLNE